MVRKRSKRKKQWFTTGLNDFFESRGWRAPTVTFFLAFLIVAVYFWLSGGELFIHPYVFFIYAFHVFFMPYNVFSYVFVHTGPIHLFSNVVFLLVLGSLVEQKLERLDPFFIFVISGMIGGIAYTLYAPGFALVGASAGVFGLLGAAVLVKPKYAFLGFLLSFLFVNFFLAPALSSLESSAGADLTEAIASAESEQAVIRSELSGTTSKVSVLFNELKALRETRYGLLERGLSTVEVDASIVSLESRLGSLRSETTALDVKIVQKNIEIDTLSERSAIHKQGVERELTVPVAIVSHVVSIFVGALYVWFLRRDRMFVV